MAIFICTKIHFCLKFSTSGSLLAYSIIAEHNKFVTYAYKIELNLSYITSQKWQLNINLRD